MQYELMKIEVYPTCLVVYPKTTEHLAAIKEFARPFVKFTEFWSKWQKKMIITPVASYISFTDDRREIRMPRTLLKELEATLNTYRLKENLHYKLEYKEVDIQVVPYHLNMKDTWSPREEQQKMVDFSLSNSDGVTLLALSTGGGKGLGVDTKIRVPNGWKKVQDLLPGDKIISEKGKPIKVTGVFPRGKKDFYRVYFKDGRYTDCDYDHLWTVYRRKQLKNGAEYIKQTLPVEEMIEIISPKKRQEYLWIPLTLPVKDTKKKLEVDPYFLGYYLARRAYAGVFSLRDNSKHILNRLTEKLPKDTELSLLNKPKGTKRERLYSVRSINYSTVRNSNYFTEFLRKYNIYDINNHELFIPEHYLYSSVEDKLELVKGIMDGSGHITRGVSGKTNKNPQFRLGLASEKLAKQFVSLIHSLGGTSSYKLHESKSTKEFYRINITITDKKQLVSSPELLERIDSTVVEEKVIDKLLITKIEKLDKQEESYCISVDNPTGLYLTEDYIVTHNTSASLYIASLLKQRFVCILRPSFSGEDMGEGKGLSGWLEEVAKSTDVKKDEMVTISGAKELKSLINLALEGNLKYKVILISNKTFQRYLKYYEQYPPEQFKDIGFNCTPQDLPKLLGIDTIFVDEAHLDTNLQFKLISYLKVNRFIGASATIDSSDRFIERMNKIAFPVERRYKQSKKNIYIQPTAFHYRFKYPNRLRFEGTRGYSHLAFEKSVMRHVGVKKHYFLMIEKVLFDYYTPSLAEDENYKCLIVVSTIAMARELANFLQQSVEDLKVNSYVEDDPDENLHGSDICISTIGSSGTGLNLAKLKTVIMTTAVGSQQTNIQVAGRLRFLGEKVKHDFIYFVCDDIKAHRNYHIDKKQIIFKNALLPVIDNHSGIVVEP